MAISHSFSPNSDRSIQLIDRDISFLAFNKRVLELSKQPSVPLLERLRYLSIVSSNLDEFFEVRASLHLRGAQNDIPKGAYSLESFDNLSDRAHELVDEQYNVYNQNIIPARRFEVIL